MIDHLKDELTKAKAELAEAREQNGLHAQMAAQWAERAVGKSAVVEALEKIIGRHEAPDPAPAPDKA